MTAPTIPAQLTDRYAARTHGGSRRVGHLLLRELTGGGRDRTALCGANARLASWRRADSFDAHVPDCGPCSVAAGIVPRAPRPLLRRPAPASAHDQYRTPSATAVLIDPQHARTALPDGWRPRRQLSAPAGDGEYLVLDPRADAYVPAAQLQREQQHAALRGQLAFPDWAPLTACATP